MSDERDPTQDVVRLLRRIRALEQLTARYRSGSNMITDRLAEELQRTHAWADEISKAHGVTK